MSAADLRPLLLFVTVHCTGVAPVHLLCAARMSESARSARRTRRNPGPPVDPADVPRQLDPFCSTADRLAYLAERRRAQAPGSDGSDGPGAVPSSTMSGRNSPPPAPNPPIPAPDPMQLIAQLTQQVSALTTAQQAQLAAAPQAPAPGTVLAKETKTPKFTGALTEKRYAKQYISDMEVFFRTHNVTIDESKLDFVQQSFGTTTLAKTWFHHARGTEFDTWATFESAFLRKFWYKAHELDGLYAEWTALTQQSHQSVDVYYNELTDLAQILESLGHKVQPSEMRLRFVAGLHAGAKFAVDQFMANFEETTGTVPKMERLVRIANTYEENRVPRKTRINPDYNPALDPTELNRETMRRNSKPSTYAPLPRRTDLPVRPGINTVTTPPSGRTSRSDITSDQCAYCKEVGHWKQDKNGNITCPALLSKSKAAEPSKESA